MALRVFQVPALEADLPFDGFGCVAGSFPDQDLSVRHLGISGDKALRLTDLQYFRRIRRLFCKPRDRTLGVAEVKSEITFHQKSPDASPFFNSFPPKAIAGRIVPAFSPGI